MKNMQEIETEFGEIYEAALKQYKEELQALKVENQQANQWRQDDEKKMNDILRDSGIDLKRLINLEKDNTYRVKKDIEKVRPQLIERQSGKIANFKKNSLHSTITSQMGAALVSPYAIIGLVPDEKFDEDVSNEIIHSIIFDHSQINESCHYEGYGSGISGIVGPTYKSKKILLHYHFVPNQTKLWHFHSIIDFHGFYILYANDYWFNSKEAGVEIIVNMDVFQYFWHGKLKIVDLLEGGDNINCRRFYDRHRQYLYPVHLKAGDSTWICIEIILVTGARGDGSYAEINFKNGNAHYIQPCAVFVY